MADGDYTLLVDETGVDGASKRVMYVGCLVPTRELEAIKDRILAFNQDCLDSPYYSRQLGLVDAVDENRHYVDDSVPLRTAFIESVIHNTPCRVYTVFDTPKATVRESKTKLFEVFINNVMSVREIKKLEIIVERSGADDKVLAEFGVEFRTKEFLPLCIADYYGAILHNFHETRLKILAEGKAIKRRELNGLPFKHYSILLDRFSLELDLSTNEVSSRKKGRFFFRQIECIVTDD